MSFWDSATQLISDAKDAYNTNVLANTATQQAQAQQQQSIAATTQSNTTTYLVIGAVVLVVILGGFLAFRK